MSPRRRLSAVPIVIVIVLLLVGLIGSTMAAPAARPSPDIPTPVPGQLAAQTAPPAPLPTPLGRYPATSEATVVASCLSGIDPNTVPRPIGQAFCVCTLNAFEQLYPTYSAFQQAVASGAITDELRTQISNRCTQALLGG